MARTRKSLPEQIDTAHLISAGVLARACPRALIDEVLRKHDRHSRRERLLPAPAVVYFVMALSLWRDVSVEQVLRVVCEGLQWLGGGDATALHASKSALSQARSRLGAEVMRELADRALGPLAQPDTPGCWYRGLRVMAIDGTCLEVADEQANAKFFGYPSNGSGYSAFPQARASALVECGTHVVVAADIQPFSTSETAMAARLLPGKLTKEMVLLADRVYYGFDLWQSACATGAKLVWRVNSNLKLPRLNELPDGSYLSAVFAPGDQARRHPLQVRVIEYAVTNGHTVSEDCYRLITNMLDEKAADALELAALYQQRWEVEGVLDEFKTHLRGSSTVLRSKTPELVQQEFWGLMLAHFAIRRVMTEAAWGAQLDPDELSFTGAVQIVKRFLPLAGAVPP